MATTYETLVNGLGQLVHTLTDGLVNTQYLFRNKRVRIHLPSDAAASTATNHVLLNVEKEITIVSVSITTNAAVATDGTDFVTLDLSKEDGAAGGFTSLVTPLVTSSVGFAARVKRSFVFLTVALQTVAAGQILALVVTKAGAGKVVPGACVEIEYRLN